MKSEVYNIDCVEFMRQYPDNYFSIGICDPPYGINAGNMTMGSGKHRFAKKLNWDKNIPDENYFNELFRVTQNQIIWGGNYFNLPLNNNWIIWDKLNPNLSFSEAEMAWCSIDNNTRIFKRLSTMPDIDGPKRHITQKPYALYKWILNKYCKGMVSVLDTHRGSDSNRMACYDFGIDFYGCEISEDYHKQSNDRFNTHIAQQKLFAPTTHHAEQIALL